MDIVIITAALLGFLEEFDVDSWIVGTLLLLETFNNGRSFVFGAGEQGKELTY